MDKQKRAASQKRYQIAHRDQIAARMRKYYTAHKKEFADYNRKWRATYAAMVKKMRTALERIAQGRGKAADLARKALCR